MDKDLIYMKEALKEALKAQNKDEVPVGCVVVHKDKIIARAHNQVETLKDPTAHAEMIAITQAAASLGSKWLQDAVVYVTIEPCLMCAGALVLARIKELVFGAKDPKTGACGSVLNIPKQKPLNHTFKVTSGVLEADCSFLISEFFKKKRNYANPA
ncbi:MAG: tRNA adenosine(34) deaminase TadA [Candidatus Omnitrophota bacterium]